MIDVTAYGVIAAPPEHCGEPIDIEVGGNLVKIRYARSAMREIKPHMHHGVAYRSFEPSGTLAYGMDGTIYWQQGGQPWEVVCLPQEFPYRRHQERSC